MATVFSRATQALTEDHGRGARRDIFLAAALLGVWGAWGCLARLAVYAVTDTARLEVARAFHLDYGAENRHPSHAARTLHPNNALQAGVFRPGHPVPT